MTFRWFAVTQPVTYPLVLDAMDDVVGIFPSSDVASLRAHSNKEILQSINS
jgi:hypothetical protein